MLTKLPVPFWQVLYTISQVTQVLLTTASHHGDLRPPDSEMAGATVARKGHWANAVTSEDIPLITSSSQMAHAKVLPLLCNITGQMQLA